MENLQLQKQNTIFDGEAMFAIILAAKARYKENKQLMYDSFMVEELYDLFFGKGNETEEEINQALENLEGDYCQVLRQEEKDGLVSYDYENENFYTTMNYEQADIELNKYSNTYGKEKVNTIKRYVIKYINQ